MDWKNHCEEESWSRPDLVVEWARETLGHMVNGFSHGCGTKAGNLAGGNELSKQTLLCARSVLHNLNVET